MRYFIDTEYLWDAAKGRVIPISIGIVAEDGREFYAQDWDGFFACDTWGDAWFMANVYPLLSQHSAKHREFIAQDIRAFIGDDVPEFWGDYSAFDYVVLSMLMGDFGAWPQGWPMHVNDLQQAGATAGPSDVPHHALADAHAVGKGFEDLDRRFVAALADVRAVRDAYDHPLATPDDPPGARVSSANRERDIAFLLTYIERESPDQFMARDYAKRIRGTSR